jgi:protein-tyrosine phosphatase
MIKICFVCHGNICRSPMAEYVLKDKINKLNLKKKFIIVSRATSFEEIGNDMHPGTKRILKENNIDFNLHEATRLEKEDYDKYDCFICMDENNMRNIMFIFDNDKDHKIFKLLKNRDVKDPWYTGNFEETYEDINIGTDRIINMYKNELEN